MGCTCCGISPTFPPPGPSQVEPVIVGTIWFGFRSRISLACHNYHDTHRVFPFGQGGTGDKYSALSLLLLFMEQAPLHQQINFSLPYSDTSNDPARLAELSLFRCPSDRRNPLPQTGGATNYMANKGSGIVWRDPTGPNVGMPPPNGVFYYRSSIRMADLIDGTSNTAAFSERILADGSNGIVSPIADVFFHGGAPMTPDEAVPRTPIWSAMSS